MEEEVPYNKRQDDTGNSTDTGTGSAVEQDSVKQKGHSRKKLVKVLTNKYFIVTFIFAVIVLFVDRNNLIRWAGDYLEVLRQERVIRQYGRDIEELDRKLDQLTSDRDSELDRKLDQLTSDRDSLEKFAREEYYFHREDEEVFIVD